MSVKKKGKWSGIKKFGYAFRGIYTSLKEEASLVIHFIVAILVLIVAAILTSKAITPKPINLTDWVIVIFVIGIIIGMELLNTAIENLVDMIAFEYNMNAKKIKDVSAGATLILSLTAIAVGLIIFIPPVIAIFTGK